MLAFLLSLCSWVGKSFAPPPGSHLAQLPSDDGTYARDDELPERHRTGDGAHGYVLTLGLRAALLMAFLNWSQSTSTSKVEVAAVLTFGVVCNLPSGVMRAK